MAPRLGTTGLTACDCVTVHKCIVAFHAGFGLRGVQS